MLKKIRVTFFFISFKKKWCRARVYWIAQSAAQENSERTSSAPALSVRAQIDNFDKWIAAHRHWGIKKSFYNFIEIARTTTYKVIVVMGLKWALDISVWALPLVFDRLSSRPPRVTWGSCPFFCFCLLCPHQGKEHNKSPVANLRIFFYKKKKKKKKRLSVIC
jgi:hypothetical protein